LLLISCSLLLIVVVFCDASRTKTKSNQVNQKKQERTKGERNAPPV
jgi:hypothetical protein